MRSPHQPADTNTSSREISEYPGHLGARTRKELVGVTFESGQEDRITRPGRTQHRKQMGEVLAAIDEDLSEVPFGPRNAVVATVDRAVSIPPLPRREEPVIDAMVFPINRRRCRRRGGWRLCFHLSARRRATRCRRFPVASALGETGFLRAPPRAARRPLRRTATRPPRGTPTTGARPCPRVPRTCVRTTS